MYISLRINHLKKEDIKKFPEKERGFIQERIRGRILELQKLGELLAQDKIKEADTNFEELKFCNTKENLYKKIILKDNFIVGAIFVGDIKNSGVFLRLIRERINVSSLKDRLLQESFGYPDIMDFVKDKERLYV